MPRSYTRARDIARVTHKGLYSFFDRLFPQRFAGSDVPAEIAPEGWERSPMLACFHPSVERVFEEQRRMFRRFDGRADLAPVYGLIFRRLKALRADWVYRFPELHLVDIPSPADTASPGDYSVSEGARDTLEAQRHGRAIDRLRSELAAVHAQAEEEAMDRSPPATVRAYREVYGRDPRGWPPA